jgi:hypothetical protein
MSEENFKTIFQNQIKAIEICLQKKLRLSALILIYSNIDILSYLHCANEINKTTRKDFKFWCKQYLMPNSNIGCSANDLYAARCAVLHTGTPISDLSRKGQAKEIIYVWGKTYPRSLEKIIHLTKRKVVIIRIEELFRGLKKAIGKFISDVYGMDEKKKEHIYSKADYLYKNNSWKFYF